MTNKNHLYNNIWRKSDYLKVAVLSTHAYSYVCQTLCVYITQMTKFFVTVNKLTIKHVYSVNVYVLVLHCTLYICLVVILFLLVLLLSTIYGTEQPIMC